MNSGRRLGLLSQLFSSIPANQEILLWFSEWGVGRKASGLTCLSDFGLEHAHMVELADTLALVVSADNGMTRFKSRICHIFPWDH